MLLVPGGLAGVASSLVCCESMTVEAGALDGHGSPQLVGHDVVVIVVLIGVGGSRLSGVLVKGGNHLCNYVTHRVPYTHAGF